VSVVSPRLTEHRSPFVQRTLPTLLAATAMTAALALPATAGLLPAVTTGTIDAAVSQAVGSTDALLHLADGVGLGSGFEAVDVVHGTGPSTAFKALAATGLATWVEEGVAVTTFTETSH
jgi:hypothetical protein